MRVVSLCPSLTETVFRLGKGATLVGRTKFCVEPRGAVDTIARVGGTKNPQIARILALHPDLVLMNEEENRREDAAALRDHGVPVLSTFARDVPEAIESVRAIGDAVAAAAVAQRLTQQLRQRAAEVAAQAAQRPAVGFAYLIWRQPWMAAGKGTYIDGLLTLAGGKNVCSAENARYPEVTAATLAPAELILLSSEPFPFTAKHRDELCAETNRPATSFRLVDGQLLSWHGARTLEGLEYAERLFAAGPLAKS